MKKLTVIVLLLGVIACSRKVVIPPEPNDVALNAAQTRWTGTTMEELKQGKTIYETSCNKCHGLKKVTSRDEGGWHKIIPSMAQKAKLSASQELLVTKYLVSASIAGGRK